MKKGALINFLLDPNYDDKQTIKDYLNDAGINPIETKKELIDLLKTKTAEQKIKNAAKLQELYEKIKNSFVPDQVNYGEPEFAFAARNMEGLSEQDKHFLIDNLSILKEMIKKENKIDG